MSAVHNTDPNPKRNAVYDVADRVEASTLTAKVARPHKSSSMTVGRDPYANDGAVGQDFLSNASTTPANA